MHVKTNKNVYVKPNKKYKFTTEIFILIEEIFHNAR